MKIRPVEAECEQPARRTDMAKIIVAFLNFANAPSSGTVTLSRISCNNCVPTFRITRRNSSKNLLLCANIKCSCSLKLNICWKNTTKDEKAQY
jgi:hypothetical protein